MEKVEAKETIGGIFGKKGCVFLLILLHVIGELCGRHQRGFCVFLFVSGEVVLLLFLEYEFELELLLLLWKTWGTRLNLVAGRRGPSVETIMYS